jgi:hypothetical protein
MKFAIQSVAFAIIFCAGWLFYVETGNPNQSFYSQSPLQGNFIKAQEFLYHGRGKKVVLVGSSISERIPSASLGAEFVNLGLIADNAFTGTEIIRRFKMRPELILVEMSLPNISRNGIGPQLLSSLESPSARHLAARSKLFEDRYQPACVFLGWLKSRGKMATTAEVVDTNVFARRLTRTISDYHEVPSESEVRAYLTSLKDPLEMLRSEGIQIAIYETPVHPALRKTPKQILIREQFDLYFPTSTWARISVESDDAFTTDDGFHLLRSRASDFAKYLRSKTLPLLSGRASGRDPLD